MKPDTRLQKDVIDEFRSEPRVNEAEVAVSAKDGVIAVAEDLKVKTFGPHERSDTEIAHAAIDALRWDTEVPDDKLTVNVENGWITLKGETEWNYQKTAAERNLRHLAGVEGISNLIVVKPRASATEVKAKIEAALKRSAELVAMQIAVETVDGKVTLTGTVRSWLERSDAERAAWGAPGVHEVHDQLVVRPSDGRP